jgi:hypothetical protein
MLSKWTGNCLSQGKEEQSVNPAIVNRKYDCSKNRREFYESQCLKTDRRFSTAYDKHGVCLRAARADSSPKV